VSPDVYQPLLAALAALVVAVLAYLTAQIRANTARLDAHAQQIAVALNGHAQASPAERAGAGGQASPRAAPLWNQLQDPLPTGALPAWGYEECGEECVAEVLYAQHGVSVAADALRFQLRGPAGRGLTDGADLVRLLALNNVAAVVATPPAAQLAAELQRITAAGRMAIVLGAWVAPGVLHWVLVTRADGQGAGYNDPWGGVRRARTWRELQPLYAGEVVEITRAPDPAS
jgi:hypothetical protein